MDAGVVEQPCTVRDGPTEALQPVPGELFYAQLGLGGLTIGESAVVVGPQGSIVLIDVGNNAHDDDVVDALDALTPAMRSAGFCCVEDRAVDAIVLTHHHADHEDGLEDLMGTITVRHHIIHRGLVDITNAANASSVEALCGVLAGHASLDTPLCEGPVTAPCNASSWSGSYASSACAGLMQGDLDAPGDSGPSFVALGGGARMTFLGANGNAGGARYEDAVGPLKTEDSNGENARSVVGLLSHGAFRFVFAGDLTGGGSDTDPVEAFTASHLPQTLLGRGVDVLHASHHGRNTSSSAAWLDALLPSDGRPRNALMGVSTAHAGSPHPEVLDALFSGRLAGGQVFTTRVAPGGTSHAGLWDAQGGQVRWRTVDGGAGYVLQAVKSNGTVVKSIQVDSVLGCRP